MTPFDSSKRILLVGEVLVDQHVDHEIVRLGGLFHLARALNATGVTYFAAYICPDYLDESCQEYFAQLGASGYRKIGSVSGAPNVALIRESTEAGDQGYLKILGGQAHTTLDHSSLESLISEHAPTDALIVAESFVQDLQGPTMKRIERLHVDFDHWKSFSIPGLQIDTALCSTSGSVFLSEGQSVDGLRRALNSLGARVSIFKENRGGSRAWVGDEPKPLSIPCHVTSTTHSVGVGDCFGAIFVAQREDASVEGKLRVAAFAASSYARTYDHAEFKRDVEAIARSQDNVIAMSGVRLPWEERPALNIYLAAPDFPDVDTSQLDVIEAALKYHNFSIRRPIRENGLATSTMSPTERRDLFAKDMAILESAALLIAAPINGDAGTLAELGLFAGTSRPTILFDPARRIDNLFVQNLPTRICYSVTELVDSVFELLGLRL